MIPKQTIRLILFLLFTQIFLYQPAFPQSWQMVSRVIDGDTLELQGGEKVRLIGINTPELTDSDTAVLQVAMEARGYLRGLAEGKKVRLEYDQDKTDKYGRTLAYLYLEDGTFINAEIVKQGYSSVYTSYPFKYLEKFQGYDRQAREAGKGLWAGNNGVIKKQQSPIEVAPKASPPASQDQTVYVTRTGKKYHRAGCRYLRQSMIPMSLKQAAARYGPCSVCRPPVP